MVCNPLIDNTLVFANQILMQMTNAKIWEFSNRYMEMPNSRNYGLMRADIALFVRFFRFLAVILRYVPQAGRRAVIDSSTAHGFQYYMNHRSDHREDHKHRDKYRPERMFPKE